MFRNVYSTNTDFLPIFKWNRYPKSLYPNAIPPSPFPLPTPCFNVALNSGVHASTRWINIENGEREKSLVITPQWSNTFGPDCRHHIRNFLNFFVASFGENHAMSSFNPYVLFQLEITFLIQPNQNKRPTSTLFCIHVEQTDERFLSSFKTAAKLAQSIWRSLWVREVTSSSPRQYQCSREN